MIKQDIINTVQTYEEAFDWGQKYLVHYGIENSYMEAFWLLTAYRSGRNDIHSFNDLILHREKAMTIDHRDVYHRMIRERARRRPLAYILGYQEFMGMKFYVNRDVLIPRQETELLVEAATRKFNVLDKLKILDIGAGSGNIGISLAAHFPMAYVVATDISERALLVAQSNADYLQKSGQMTFWREDLIFAMDFNEKGAQNSDRNRNLLWNSFDVIVSNPPYIQSREIDSLQEEVQSEPRIALDGGPDGLRMIRRIVCEGPKFLKRGGWLFLEIGHDQGNQVYELMQKAQFNSIEIRKDYAHLDRIAIGKNG